MAKTINLTAIRNKKAINPSKTENDEIKPVEQLFIGQYLSLKTFQYHPLTVKFVEHECVRLVEWAQLEDSLVLLDFIDIGGYSEDTFYDWCKKFSNFEEAHLYAKRKIGSRREIGALTRKFDGNFVARMMGHYSRAWREEMVFTAKLREDTSKQNDIKIVIEEMPWQPGPMAPCMLDAVIEPKLSPEEVAGKIHKLTTESRCEGAGQYVAKYKIKEQK